MRGSKKKRRHMSMIPTVEQACELLKEYNSEPFHLKHAEMLGMGLDDLITDTIAAMRATPVAVFDR